MWCGSAGKICAYMHEVLTSTPNTKTKYQMFSSSVEHLWINVYIWLIRIDINWFLSVSLKNMSSWQHQYLFSPLFCVINVIHFMFPYILIIPHVIIIFTIISNQHSFLPIYPTVGSFPHFCAFCLPVSRAASPPTAKWIC